MATRNDVLLFSTPKDISYLFTKALTLTNTLNEEQSGHLDTLFGKFFNISNSVEDLAVVRYFFKDQTYIIVNRANQWERMSFSLRDLRDICSIHQPNIISIINKLGFSN